MIPYELGPPLVLCNCGTMQSETKSGVIVSRPGRGKFEVVPWTQTFCLARQEKLEIRDLLESL